MVVRARGRVRESQGRTGSGKMSSEICDLAQDRVPSTTALKSGPRAFRLMMALKRLGTQQKSLRYPWNKQCKSLHDYLEETGSAGSNCEPLEHDLKMLATYGLVPRESNHSNFARALEVGAFLVFKLKAGIPPCASWCDVTQLSCGERCYPYFVGLSYTNEEDKEASLERFEKKVSKFQKRYN